MRYTLKSELSKSSGIVPPSSQMLDLHSRNSRVPQATLWTTTVERPVIRQLPDEVIEDSEPEREESRRRRKEERQKQKELKKPTNLEHTTSNSDECPGSANLEQASNSTTRKLPQKESTVVNNLSSLSTTCCNTDGSNFYDLDSMKAKNAVEKRAGVITDLPVSHSVQNVVTILSESNTSDSEVDEKRTDKMRTKLGHFAFPVTSQASSLASSISRTSSTVVQSTCSANAPSGVQTENRKRPLSSTPAYLDFSENQLKTLVKCVSCDLKWTTRKSTAHKVTHMRTCAKKSRLTEETMKILISRETSVAPPKVKKPRPIKDRPSERPQRTYLEDIIKEDGIQRPRKRQKELTGSVRGVVESRTGIVERANLILNKPSSSRSTTDDCMRLQPPPQPPPSTQTFAQSTLASRINGISSWSQDEAEPPCCRTGPVIGGSEGPVDVSSATLSNVNGISYRL
ncbi:uncharacterized protein FOMMEDRAFT_30101 [Fomitiporia mediterranea MF3/22]|uniref:uncharacterized protein n=1 Tax=Fomitiporia mediterranea (strain MF3/22) TaxID=694068 RepID=UPI0004407B17|nr:uncharacterized protein FOMMEDRAFT_30101 [Fomitiporia mediterranea MF3/22]EJD01399.1 hypothetical protein FOMMEDRAFT_30101 [Fomitiporia mediterranea MF3/22]